MRPGDLGHEHDERVFGLGVVEFGGGGGRNVENVARPFDHGELEAEADAQEGHFLFAGVLDGEHHAFGAAVSEATWDEDAAVEDRCQCRIFEKYQKFDSLGTDDSSPGIVIPLGVRLLRLRLQVRRFDPVDGQLPVDPERRMLKGLRNRHVRVLEVGVLANKGDGDGVEEAFLTIREKIRVSICAPSLYEKKYQPSGQFLPPFSQLCTLRLPLRPHPLDFLLHGLLALRIRLARH